MTTENLFSGVTPGNNPGQATPICLGVRFSSSAAGNVLGIRVYYDGAFTVGTTAKLWSDAGSQLATKAATLTGTPARWVEVLFDTPYAIDADTFYRTAINVRNVPYDDGILPLNNGQHLTANASYYNNTVDAFPNTAPPVAGRVYYVGLLFEAEAVGGGEGSDENIQSQNIQASDIVA